MPASKMSFVVSIDLDHWAEVVFVRFLHSGELLFTPFLCHALEVAVWGTYLGVGWGPVAGGLTGFATDWVRAVRSWPLATIETGEDSGRTRGGAGRGKPWVLRAVGWEVLKGPQSLLCSQVFQCRVPGKVLEGG